MFVSRRRNQIDNLTKLLLVGLATLMTVPGLYSCNSKSGTKATNPGSSSGGSSIKKTAPSTSLSQPSSKSSGLPLPDSDAKSKLKTAPGGAPADPKKLETLLGLDGKPLKKSPNQVNLPPDLAKTASPVPTNSQKIPQTTDSSLAGGSPVPSPSAPSSGVSNPSVPAAPSSDTSNPSGPSVASPNVESAPSSSDIQSDPTLTEEAKSLNQPRDPSLRLTPSSPPSAPTDSESGSTPTASEPATPIGGPASTPTGSGPSSAPRSNSSAGLSSSNNSNKPASGRSKPSGLRQPEYVYDPSTGVYSTETAGD